MTAAERAEQAIASVVERMESRYPERVIARACLDALKTEGLTVCSVDESRPVEAFREIRRTALSAAGGDRERYRAKMAEVIEITGRALGEQ